MRVELENLTLQLKNCETHFLVKENECRTLKKTALYARLIRREGEIHHLNARLHQQAPALQTMKEKLKKKSAHVHRLQKLVSALKKKERVQETVASN